MKNCILIKILWINVNSLFNAEYKNQKKECKIEKKYQQEKVFQKWNKKNIENQILIERSHVMKTKLWMRG